MICELAGEISAAAGEQSAGIGQVHVAVAELDGTLYLAQRTAGQVAQEHFNQGDATAPAGGPDALTAREREVATLLVALLGFVAARDVVSFLRNDKADAAGTAGDHRDLAFESGALLREPALRFR